MTKRHYRIIAVIDPLPAGESMVRQFAAIIREYEPRNVLWVTLCDDIGMGFENCHLPFLTPMEWMERTQADVALRLQELLRHLGGNQSEFRMLPGSPNRALANLSEEWCADLLLAKESDVGRIMGSDGQQWWPPLTLACSIQTVATLSFRQRSKDILLKNFNIYLKPLIVCGGGMKNRFFASRSL